MKKLKKLITLAACAAAANASVLSAGISFNAAADETYLIRDKWGYCKSANYVESEHFVIFYGNNDTTGEVNEAFLKRNLEDYEKLWHCYGEYLGMTDMNVDIYGKSSQKYKTNVYLTYTGLEQYAEGWAFMSSEDGYGIEIISPKAMLDDLTIAHEFGHVVTMQQKAWVDQDITGAWWESLANWFREMYLASDYYTGSVKTCWFEPYIRNMSLTLPHGRNYYEVWPFLMYLSYNPDNISGLGTTFVKRMISEAKADEYPFDTVARLTGTDAQTIFGNYAKRMATFDLGAKEAYREEFAKKLKEVPYYWNLFYTVPEDKGTDWLQSPQEEAPMQGGINIVPLEITGDTISVSLRGLSDDKNAGWQACIVIADSSGKTSYSELFGSGEKVSVPAGDAVSAYLTVSAMPRELYRVNAFHKEKDSSYKDGDERRRYPYEIKLSGAEVQQSGGYSKGRGHIHSNGGGWVADTAKVADSVYVGKDAMVLGSAVVSGNARIEDHAVVAGSAAVKDNAVISGHAVVDGGGWVYVNNGWVQTSAEISGNAVVTDSAVVTAGCKISGNAKVCQKAYVSEVVTVKDNAVIKGNSYLYGSGTYSGSVITDGDYSNDLTKNSGIGFGWLDDSGWHDISDGYGAYYDFSGSSVNWAKDRSSATNARQAGAEWGSERTSAKGVINFSGGDDCLILDDSLLMTDDIQISLAALWKGGAAGTELLHFGDSRAYLSFTPSNREGAAELILTDGTVTEKLTASAPLSKGEWNRVTIRMIDGKAALIINSDTVASSTVTLTPLDIMSASEEDNAVIGKGFSGAVDYVQVSYKETAEPDIKYSGKEEVTDTGLRGDVDANGRFEAADLVLMQRWLLGMPGTELKDWKAGDLYADGQLDTFDLCLMRKLIIS
ncbi:MAG: N-acetylglucosamine-1-phosphate uridyltransferase [Ruminococcus sp.]|nr:N-acetylglucosamine-1-phosphate uridyltransferase [Ruminococcus sp.]